MLAPVCILTVYSKIIRQASKIFTELCVAVSRWLMVMAIVSAIPPGHSSSVKACLANRQYKKCFKEISK